MRALALFALLLPSPALADLILAQSHISHVTVYPQGAQVTREVVFTAPAGNHDLLITDLPQDTAPQLIGLTGGAGLGLGAYALRTDRLPPQEGQTNPALEAAKAEVAAWEAKEQAAIAAVEAVQARVGAAEAQAGFLGNVRAEGGTLTPEAIKALASMIGTEVLAAKEAALAAKADLPAAEKALAEVQEGLAKARAAEEAVLTGAENYASLAVALSVATEGEQHLTVTHYIGEASWAPVYDLMLSRSDAALTVKRGVLVSQFSGEDWRDVDLTLSTAQPSSESAPSQLWADRREIYDPVKEAEEYARMAAASGDAMAEPVMESEPEVVEMATALAGFEGDTVVYHYPVAVDVASGVENLRLALDEKAFKAKVYAQAVPRLDATAFVMAKFTNDSGEVLLPGEAFLMREGVLVGSTELSILAPGVETEVAFGAIDGLRLSRDMPKRAEGDRGIISTTTQVEETAVLKLENLTNETWPLRVLDSVPYSEQEDLEISYQADPAPTEVDVKGQRGILAWEFDMAAGEKKEIRLTHVLSWPQGMELR